MPIDDVTATKFHTSPKKLYWPYLSEVALPVTLECGLVMAEEVVISPAVGVIEAWVVWMLGVWTVGVLVAL